MTKAIRLIYHPAFAAYSVSFELAKGSYLKYLDKKLELFWSLSLADHGALLKRRVGPEAFFVGECYASASLAACRGGPDD